MDINMIIKLFDLTNRSDAHGTKEGKAVYDKLLEIVSSNFSENTFNISLDGIEKTDASFPRESVLSIAKQYRDEGKWFFVSGDMSADTFFNWSLAAEYKDQPLVLWTGDKYRILGNNPGTSLSSVIEVIMKDSEVTAASLADKLKINVPNASSKLKKLFTKGYISRFEQVAESGGIEFVYKAIK
tara:strand:- start:183 stop:734 length:552 start_codon:yes stop_codon:yes gene_type:complete